MGGRDRRRQKAGRDVDLRAAERRGDQPAKADAHSGWWPGGNYLAGAPQADLSDADAAAGKERPVSASDGVATVAEGGGMVVAEIPRETLDTIRQKQSDRLSEAGRLARRAVTRFESILRRREAAPVIAQGFGSSASKRVVGWYRDNLQKCGFKVLDLAGVSEGGEWADHKLPVGFKDVPIVGTAYEATKEGIDATNHAERASAIVGVVDDLVSSTMARLEQVTADAAHRLTAPGNDPYMLELDRATDYGRPPIAAADVDELIATLDAMYSRAMFDLGPARGGYTVEEYGERIGARKQLQAEIDATRTREDEPK